MTDCGQSKYKLLKAPQLLPSISETGGPGLAGVVAALPDCNSRECREAQSVEQMRARDEIYAREVERQAKPQRIPPIIPAPNVVNLNPIIIGQPNRYQDPSPPPPAPTPVNRDKRR